MNIQLTIEGKIEKAFKQFCLENSCSTNAEGFRAMVRSLEQYKSLPEKEKDGE